MATAAPAKTLTFTRSITAPAGEIYRALTTRDGMNLWLSDNSLVTGRVGGSLLLQWNRGYYASGVFTALEADSQVAFTWRGPKEAETEVTITLEDNNEAVTVTLQHGGFGPEFNDEALNAFTAEWEGAIDRLKSSLETGADLRITNRVIVGIFPGGVPQEEQKRLGISAQEGVNVNRTLPDLGAEKAGLQRNDILVNIAGEDISATNNMVAITGKYKPGDTIDVTFYRDGEKQTLPMTLSGYPVPHIPDTFEEMADITETAFAELGREMDDLFNGVSAEQASAKPAEGEWSANDVLAHLILNEQFTHILIGQFTQGNQVQGGYSANSDSRIHAMQTLHPTSADLIAAYKAAMHETVVLLRAVAETLNDRKYTVWNLAFNMDFLPQHTRGHFVQIKEAIEAARGA